MDKCSPFCPHGCVSLRWPSSLVYLLSCGGTPCCELLDHEPFHFVHSLPLWGRVPLFSELKDSPLFLFGRIISTPKTSIFFFNAQASGCEYVLIGPQDTSSDQRLSPCTSLSMTLSNSHWKQFLLASQGWQDACPLPFWQHPMTHICKDCIFFPHEKWLRCTEYRALLRARSQSWCKVAGNIQCN